MKRTGWIAKAKPDMVQKYVELHANTWPAVLKRNKDCNLQNYSIFLKVLPNGEHYLFSYVEYTGKDFEADMARMAADPEVQRWWAECKPCLEGVEDLPPDRFNFPSANETLPALQFIIAFLFKCIPMVVKDSFECVFIDAFHGCSLRTTITELAK